MKNLKKIALLSTLALLFTVAACNAVNSSENNSSSVVSSPIVSSEFSRSDDSTNEDSVSSADSEENSDSNSSESNFDSSESESDSDSSSASDSSSIEDDDEDNGYEEIMDEAYALYKNEAMSGIYELSGVVTEIDVEYTSSSKSVCLYFRVDEPQNRSMYCYMLQGDGVELLDVGDTVWVSGYIKNYKGLVEFEKNCELVRYEISPDNIHPDESGDPYVGVSSATFYANYEVAKDADDAYYRSQHGFMSGTLETPDQAPTISSYQPKINGKYVRNSEMLLSEDGKTYTVVDVYGNEAFRVYKGGAYVTLEEVAAYVYAFGSYPANYTTSKDTKPTKSVWGEYLRLNHTAFSGNTSQYPYEPVLPNISGCGGDLHYYEMDIGTTGTDCDPSYTAELYNDGKTITRGAARIVYGKQDLNGNGVYEIGEFYVFYTYNHYNDFQEYLNYEGGWGEMFGNITGGGTISSKKDYNPTDYVEVVLAPISSVSKTALYRIDFICDDRRYAAARA